MMLCLTVTYLMQNYKKVRIYVNFGSFLAFFKRMIWKQVESEFTQKASAENREVVIIV